MYDIDDEKQLPQTTPRETNFTDDVQSLTQKPTLLSGIPEELNWKSNNPVTDINQTVDSSFPIKKRWNGRIAHPRRLISSMKANLEDLGYQVETNYNDEPGPVRDTSYFQGNIIANQFHQNRNTLLFIIGILTIIIIVGYWIVKISNKQQQSLIEIEFEGESYFVEARQEHTMNIPYEKRSTYSERTGVVSDISITLQAGVFSGHAPDKDNNSRQSLHSEFYLFTTQVTENIVNIWNNSTIT